MTEEEKIAKRRAYNREWAKKNKEHLRQYKENHKDKIKAWSREYYQKNKDEIDAKAKEYRRNNRAKVTKIIDKRRKEVSNELKAKGTMFTYFPKTQRENKNCEYVSKKLKISFEEARDILIANDWNTKKVVCDKNENK